MLSSSRDILLKLSETLSPQKLFDYDCVTLYLLNARHVVNAPNRISRVFIVSVCLHSFATRYRFRHSRCFRLNISLAPLRRENIGQKRVYVVKHKWSIE